MKEGRKRRDREQFLILTQRALHCAISPNYEGKERSGGESEITQKIKKLSMENLENFPKYTNFPDEHIS